MIQVLSRSIPIFPFLCSKAILKWAPIAMSRAGNTTGHNPGKHFRESGIYCVTPAPSALLCLHLLTVTRKHSAISKPQLSTTSPMLALAGSIWLEISRNSKAQGDYKHNFASLSVKKKKKKVQAGKEIRGRLSILSVWLDPQVCIRWNHTPIRIPSEMSIQSIVLIFQVADLYCCLPHKSGI